MLLIPGFVYVSAMYMWYMITNATEYVHSIVSWESLPAVRIHGDERLWWRVSRRTLPRRPIRFALLHSMFYCGCLQWCCRERSALGTNVSNRYILFSGGLDKPLLTHVDWDVIPVWPSKVLSLGQSNSVTRFKVIHAMGSTLAWCGLYKLRLFRLMFLKLSDAASYVYFFEAFSRCHLLLRSLTSSATTLKLSVAAIYGS